MVRRAVRTLAAVTPDVVVVSSLPVDAGVPVLPDRVPGKGPLGGLDAALREARSRGRTGVLLLACDLPLVDAELLASVVRSAGSASAAAPERRGGGIEPLCAVWAVGTLQTVERRLSGEDLSLHGLFREVGGVVIAGAHPEKADDRLLNVNTQGDRRRAEAVLRRRDGGTAG
jgi:molybdenum cofactor guanylyltransferase